MTVIRNALRGGRSALTVVGIAIGVFAIVLISVVSETGSAGISQAMADMGINSVMVQAQSDYVSDLSDKDIEVLSHIGGIRKAMPLMGSYTESMLCGQTGECMVWGVNNEANEIISLDARYGRLINKGDVEGEKKVCVVDEELAVAAYGRSNIVGKAIRLYLGGEYHTFSVTGVARSGVSSLRNTLSGVIPKFVYIPYTTMQELTGKSSYDRIAVLTEPTADSEAISEQITRGLSQNRISDEGISVNNLQQQKSQLDGILSTLKLLLSLVAGISLLVSGITVMTTMLASVSERRREIGIKKAIGAKNGTLAAEFLREGFFITSVGGLAGITLGFAVSLTGCAVLGVTMRADFGLIAASFAAAVLVGIVFSVYPAMKAASLHLVEALRE